MLTIKSDDVNGRSRAYEAIIKGEEIQKPSIPASFYVLVRELQSLGLNIELIGSDGEITQPQETVVRKATPTTDVTEEDEDDAEAIEEVNIEEPALEPTEEPVKAKSAEAA